MPSIPSFGRRCTLLRVCPTCKHPLEGKRPNARFCCPNCRYKWRHLTDAKRQAMAQFLEPMNKNALMAQGANDKTGDVESETTNTSYPDKK